MAFYETEFDQRLFAKKIIEKCLNENITVRSAALEIGIGQATLIRLRSANSYYPNIISYCKVCDWLDVELDEFLKPKKNK